MAFELQSWLILGCLVYEQKPLDVRSTEVLNHAQFTIDEHGELKNIEIDQKTDFAPRGSNLGTIFIFTDNPHIADSFEVLVMATAMFVIPLAYGGVHLSAWNFEFPTAVESLLWKISGIVMAGTMPRLGLMIGLDDRVSSSCLRHILASLCWSIMFVFLACRIYIVVEAFLSLRAVPIGVYWTAAWIQVIPHV